MYWVPDNDCYRFSVWEQSKAVLKSIIHRCKVLFVLNGNIHIGLIKRVMLFQCKFWPLYFINLQVSVLK